MRGDVGGVSQLCPPPAKRKEKSERNVCMGAPSQFIVSMQHIY